ncbi:glycosyl transferase, group 2 family protein [Hydrogenimonas sp.]|nr:glycosyl transferase, group 2 family protein [Hydrogenimonas sp.]
MIDFWVQTIVAFYEVVVLPMEENLKLFLMKFIPFIIFFEVPVYLLIIVGVMRYGFKRYVHRPRRVPYYPKVSCVVLCYAEGEAVSSSIVSLSEQIYPGSIEIVAVIDGASKNRKTYDAVRALEGYVSEKALRDIRIIPKWQRGGRVSSINSGVKVASGEIVMVVDADTSFDNNMVERATRHFIDENVVAVAGNLRVRNWKESLVTRHQAIEYILSIYLAKIGLGEFNLLNNVSGAFGVFRKSFVEKIGFWNTGTAEDLDMTLRIKNYFGRHKNLRIVFEPEAIGHTDVPGTWRGYLEQRLRWDGDLLYIYHKHFMSFSARMVGKLNLLALVWTGLFFQITMPFLIYLYLCYSLFFYGAVFTAALSLLAYLFYFAVTCLFFIIFLFWISERKEEDMKLVPMLFLYPVFAFFMRLWSGVALAREVVINAHLDSSMAPWWVLKKSDI